jgi:hypothetical protein
MTTEWLDAFVDVPPESAAAFREFWSQVTGWPESTARGDRGQFRSLLPPEGRAYLRVQELAGSPRLHLDLVSTDRPADAQRLIGLGASRVDSVDGVEILASPAGQVFCLVQDDEPRPDLEPQALAHRWPGGHRSRPTQLVLDIPPAAFDAEVAFWVGATGWTTTGTSFPEYTFVQPASSARPVPLRLLLQRLARPEDRLGAHLDLGCTDIPAEVSRVLALGAIDEGRVETWHVLRDPVLGLPFCVTDQTP